MAYSFGGGAGVDAGGMVNVYDAADNVTIDLNGNSHRIDLTADYGEPRAQLSGSSTGFHSLLVLV